MPITMLYAGLLALVFLALSGLTIRMRGKAGVNLGDGGKPEMLRLIRGHANFAEYVPLILVLMALLENAGRSPTLLHALGATLLVARLLHGYAFALTQKFVIGRFAGAGLTLLVLGVAGVACIVTAVKVT